MTPVTRIFAAAALLCAWAGTSAYDGSVWCTEWRYGKLGEEEWPFCSESCRGRDQSPIDINLRKILERDIPPLSGSLYDERNTAFTFSITNNGHTVELQLLDGVDLYLEGGPLQDRYHLNSITFTWGSSDEGSEHTVNGNRFAMEVQWGLYNERYTSYEEASEYPGGILKIAELMALGEEDNPSLAPIVEALPSIREPGQSAYLEEPIVYSDLFVEYIDEYYLYNGSLTTPPCSETVMWLVYLPMHGVSESQLAAFLDLQSIDGPVVNNYRSLQKSKGREVVHPSCPGGTCKKRSTAARKPGGARRLATRAGHQATSKRHGTARRSHR